MQYLNYNSHTNTNIISGKQQYSAHWLVTSKVLVCRLVKSGISVSLPDYPQ